MSQKPPVSLEDEATINLSNRKLKRLTGKSSNTDLQTIENIRRWFKDYILSAPIAIEILAKWYKIDNTLSWLGIAEAILNQCDSIDFFTLDIGSRDLDLLQKEVLTTKPIKLPPTEVYAWAVKFSGVYGLDLYFIPYIDNKKGFACTVIAPGPFDTNIKLGTYSEDILREDAVNWIANYKESQEK